MLCIRCMRSLEEEDELHFLTKTCEKCFSEALSSGEKKVVTYLESLDLPAALVSEDQTVLISNDPFQRLAPGRNVTGLRIGEVIECTYSPILGRCGETVACLLCKLRGSIERTVATREGIRGVAVSFPSKTEGRKTYTITTEPINGAVLVLIGSDQQKSAR